MRSLPREKMLTGGYTRKFLPTDKKSKGKKTKLRTQKKRKVFGLMRNPVVHPYFAGVTLLGVYYTDMSRRFKNSKPSKSLHDFCCYNEVSWKTYPQ